MKESDGGGGWGGGGERERNCLQDWSVDQLPSGDSRCPIEDAVPLGVFFLC